jgi:hypothetical protein
LQIIRANFLLGLTALKVRCGSSFTDQVRRNGRRGREAIVDPKITHREGRSARMAGLSYSRAFENLRPSGFDPQAGRWFSVNLGEMPGPPRFSATCGIIHRRRSTIKPTWSHSLFFREEIMTKFVSFIAIAAFALSASSAEAAKKKPHVAAARSAPVQTSAPVQSIHPRLENAVWLPPHQE